MTATSKQIPNNFINKIHLSLITLLCTVLTACTTVKIDVSNQMLIPANAPIGVAAFANHSSTPLANRQVESMVVGLLQTRGFRNIKHYEHSKSCAKLLYCPDESQTKAQILRWARANHLVYVFTGAANEWRYKVGLDGEPVAGATLSAINVRTGRTEWTGVGSTIGGSRSGLDEVGQSMLNSILVNIIPTY
ncbi:hypothetical protein BN59_02360 [Legionella massiliensis]|uniref:Lipoprotein n=1 Tax=Legionella massiliensis TaxID=1034943 RepID=A0A078L211_9GAMM|nr:hypothetical protein [Legionella massiliensis]CDZ78063.1 hypothetical protein BN59_02360 [Legionella massiliensis]CEE13801.1 hypothetical protein BN1094_02360 [Legionella massiliensis]